MARLTRTELLKLRTNGSLARFALAAVALSLLLTVVHVSQADFGRKLPFERQTEVVIEGSSDRLVLNREAVRERDVRTALSAWSAVGLVALILGIASVTSEERHGTLLHTLLATPHRRRMLASKLIATVVMSVALALLAAIVAVAVGFALLASRGVSAALPAGTLAGVLAGGLAATAISAALGAGIGAIVRSPTAGVVFALATLLLVDPAVAVLLADQAPGLEDYTPGQSAAALTGAGLLGGLAPEGGLEPLLGGVVYLGWAALAVACGSSLFERRDLAAS